MRALGPAMIAALTGDALTLATAWRIVRADGQALGFTDCDAPIDFDGLTYAPAAIGVGAQADHEGAAPEIAHMLGVLSGETLAAADLEAGLFDGASVEIWRVDWRNPVARVRVFRGRFGAVRRAGAGFEVGVEDVRAALERPVGRVYARTCDADLGDGRCGVALAGSAWSGDALIVEAVAPRIVRASGLSAYADGWFDHGALRWGGRRSTRIRLHRTEGALARLELDGAGPDVGTAARVEAGCDKAFATCRDKFANAVNFRGFAHMIGPDGLIRGPGDGEPADGSARR